MEWRYRLARRTKHFLEVLDELDEVGVQSHSQREAIASEGRPIGCAPINVDHTALIKDWAIGDFSDRSGKKVWIVTSERGVICARKPNRHSAPSGRARLS